MGTAIVVLFVARPLTLDLVYGRGWRDRKLFEWTGPLGVVSRAIDFYGSKYDGAIPTSLDVLKDRTSDLQEWTSVRTSATGTNVISRAALLRDYVAPSGQRYEWIVAVRIPKDGPFGFPQQDWLAVAADYRERDDAGRHVRLAGAS